MSEAIIVVLFLVAAASAGYALHLKDRLTAVLEIQIPTITTEDRPVTHLKTERIIPKRFVRHPVSEDAIRSLAVKLGDEASEYMTVGRERMPNGDLRLTARLDVLKPSDSL